jgi:hypothetical protein
MAKKQQWTGVRIGPGMYKELKVLSKIQDVPMSSILRKLWNKYKKEVLK